MPKITKAAGPTPAPDGNVRSGDGLREQYESQSVGELREELDSRELDTSGNKPDLVERLLTNDAAQAQDAAANARVEESEGLEHGDAESGAPPESDAEDGDAVDNRAEYEAATVEQLRAELKRRSLVTTGTKPELIDRLVADDAEYEAEERL